MTCTFWLLFCSLHQDDPKGTNTGDIIQLERRHFVTDTTAGDLYKGSICSASPSHKFNESLCKVQSRT
jgi:hypothetical protein